MTIDISKDIQDAIAKNLPHAVGQELQQVLAKADLDATALAAVIVKRDELTARVAALTTELAVQKANLAKHEALEVREAAVAKREADITIRELQQELAAEKRISAHGLSVTSLLVRNTEYRESLRGKVPVPLEGQPPSPGNSYGSPPFVSAGDVDTTRTRAAE